jgi:hypothetical protein
MKGLIGWLRFPRVQLALDNRGWRSGFTERDPTLACKVECTPQKEQGNRQDDRLAASYAASPPHVVTKISAKAPLAFIAEFFAPRLQSICNASAMEIIETSGETSGGKAMQEQWKQCADAMKPMRPPHALKKQNAPEAARPRTRECHSALTAVRPSRRECKRNSIYPRYSGVCRTVAATHQAGCAMDSRWAAAAAAASLRTIQSRSHPSRTCARRGSHHNGPAPPAHRR